jgi:hypothetical protein
LGKHERPQRLFYTTTSASAAAQPSLRRLRELSHVQDFDAIKLIKFAAS